MLRALIAAAHLLALGGTAEAQYRVSNRTTPAFVVVNRTTAPCSVCQGCACAPGVCPACPAAGATLTIGGVPHALGSDGVYRPVGAGEPQLRLDCSSGKCRWVEAGPIVGGPAFGQVFAGPTLAGGCASGNCGSASGGFGRAPRFAFPRK